MAILVDHEIRRLCVECKETGSKQWKLVGLDEPMIFPFSEGVQGKGVISYGLTSAGYDLRLGYYLLVFSNINSLLIDPKLFSDEEYKNQILHKAKLMEGKRGQYFVIPPNSYALGVSLEHIHIPRHLKGRCTGKSTYARQGLICNLTPVEPNWSGYLTIEMSNSTPCPAIVYAGEGISQLEFETLSSLPEKDYAEKGGKYQFQGNTPVPSIVL